MVRKNKMPKISKDKEELIKRELEVLTHIQEEYKFNYQININSISNLILIFASYFIPLVILGLTLIINQNKVYGIPLVLSFILYPIFTLVFTRKERKELKDIKKNYRDNVKKMKKKYIKLGVNVNQFYKK